MAPPATRDHVLGGRLRAQEDALVVDGDRPLPRLVALVDDAARLVVRAGVVDEHVERAADRAVGRSPGAPRPRR